MRQLVAYNQLKLLSYVIHLRLAK